MEIAIGNPSEITYGNALGVPVRLRPVNMYSGIFFPGVHTWISLEISPSITSVIPLGVFREFSMNFSLEMPP